MQFNKFKASDAAKPNVHITPVRNLLGHLQSILPEPVDETVHLCMGVCPKCGGQLKTEFVEFFKGKKKVYYECEADPYHYFYRDRMEA